jgi:hypothetical protein
MKYLEMYFIKRWEGDIKPKKLLFILTTKKHLKPKINCKTLENVAEL